MKLRLPALFALIALLLTACNVSLAEDITPPPDYVAPTPAPTVGPLFPASMPNQASGAAIYTQSCAPCHGVTGLGDGEQASKLTVNVPGLGVAEIARRAAPATWFNIVTQGNMQNFMPPFANALSDEQRWDVVAYAYSLSVTPEEVASGKALYEAKCAECHGLDGAQAANANLADQAQMAKLSQNDLVDFIRNGIAPMMPATELADAEAFALAAYVRSFTFGNAAQVAAAPQATPQGTPAAGDPTPESGAAESAPAATPVEKVGVISGAVTNGSGGEVPSNLVATLHVFDHNIATQEFKEGESIETPVRNGKYTFNDVSLVETRAYFVTVEHAGTVYESAPAIPAQDGLSAYDLPITIFDTTTSKEFLVIAQGHILFDYSKPDVVQVVEFLIVTNNGKASVVAEQEGGPVVNIDLPAGYTNLQFQDGVLGGRYIQTETGFADTQPVAPGVEQYQIVFAYDMALPKSNSPLNFFGAPKLEIVQPFSLRAESVSVLAPVGVKVEGSNLVQGEVQDMGNGITYQSFSAGAVESGSQFKVSISGQPSGSQAVTGSDSTQNIIIGVGAFGVALILSGVFLFLRDRRMAADAETDEEEEDDDETEEDVDIDNVMDAIIALDDQFKAGNITEDVYKKRRAELKAKLQNQI